MDFYDEIYYSLTGQMEETAALSWVRNAFGPGCPCQEAYARLLEARDRVLEKLGTGEDPDLEQMLGEMDTIQHILCREALALRVLPA